MTLGIQTPIPDPLASVPANFRKGAKPSWHQQRRHRAVLKLLRGISGRVLDYGCGYGDLTDAISQTHQAVGCDVDADRVAFAKREYAPLEFVQCSPEGAPFDDRSFDVVVSAVVIHFVPDPIKYLSEIRRLLRDGGHLLIVCKSPPVVRNFCRRIVGKGNAPSRLWVRPQSEMRSLLANQGFTIIDSTYFYDPPIAGWKNLGDWVFGSIEQLLSVCRIKRAAGYRAYLTRMSGV